MDLFDRNSTCSIFRILLPYLPPSYRRWIGILLLMEQMQEAMRMFRELNSLASIPQKKPEGSILDILKKNCPPKEREMFELYETMMQTFQLFQQFQPFDDAASPETDDSAVSNRTDPPSGASAPPFNPSDLLQSLLAPEHLRPQAGRKDDPSGSEESP